MVKSTGGRGGEHAAGQSRRGALAAGGSAYAELLSDGRIRLFLFVAFLLHGGAHLGLPFVTLYLEEQHGWESTGIGWVASATGLGTVVLLLTMERFRRRYGAVPATWLATGCTGAHLGCTVLTGAAPVQALGFFCRGGFQTMATLTTVGLTEMVSRARLAPAIAAAPATVASSAMAGARRARETISVSPTVVSVAMVWKPPRQKKPSACTGAAPLNTVQAKCAPVQVVASQVAGTAP